MVLPTSLLTLTSTSCLLYISCFAVAVPEKGAGCYPSTSRFMEMQQCAKRSWSMQSLYRVPGLGLYWTSRLNSGRPAKRRRTNHDDTEVIDLIGNL